MKRYGKLLFAALIAVLLTAALLLPAFAAEETEEDGGDLLLAEDQAIVRDAVGGDLLAFATELTVRGDVQGSIRAFAAELLLDGVVNRNVTVAGMTVECGESFHAKDVKIAGNQIVFYGECDTLSVFGTTVYIGGTVHGEIICEAGQVVLLEGASFASAKITSSSEPVVAKRMSDTSFAPLAGSAFDESVKFVKTRSAFVQNLVDLPITLLGAAVLALVVALVCSRISERASRIFRSRPVPFCLKGLAAMILIPVFAILLLLPLITWPISVSLLLVYFVLVLVADALTAVVLSRLLLARWNPYLSAVFLSAVLAILSVIPYIGGLVSFFSMTVAFGTVVSLVLTRRESIVSERPEMDFRV